MATSRNNNCNSCGCTDTYVATQPCPPSCPEVFNSQCIVYTGTNILCGQDTVISRYDYLDTVITKLVNYFCAGLANAPVTIVESDSVYIDVTSSTVGNTTTYVIDLDFAQLQAALNLTLPVYNVVGSNNIFVATTVVGTTTIFTISGFETKVINSDGLLNVTANITPGVDIIYTVDVDLVALTAALPQTSVIGGPSGNSFITPSVVGNMTTYSVDSKESIVAAGTHVIVTASGGTAPSYDTTYTVNGKDTTLALSSTETILQLATATPTPNTTAYTLSTNTTALNLFVNTEINDVLDNTISLFGIDAVYDNLTQTLSVEFIGAAVDGVTITGDGTAANPLTSTALAASLSNAGVVVGNQTLVNDGTGPTLATKGLNAGTGITLSSSATDITIATTLNKYTRSVILPGAGSVTITHNLNTLDVIVAASSDGIPPYNSLSQGTDYNYTVTSSNTIDINDISFGGGPIRVTVIG